MMRPCLECGEPSDLARCPAHASLTPRTPKRPGKERGYDARWRRLSRRARQLQPFCSDCGTTDDLTTDHSPRAWERHERGLAIRLADVDVVCRSCNSKRGRARPLGGDPGGGSTEPRAVSPNLGPQSDRAGGAA